jgi:hypothetical protein
MWPISSRQIEECTFYCRFLLAKKSRSALNFLLPTSSRQIEECTFYCRFLPTHKNNLTMTMTSSFCFVSLVLHYLVFLFSLGVANASKRGDQYHLHHQLFIRKSFLWMASLNNRTGAATSREESTFQSKHHNRYHHFHPDTSAGGRRNGNYDKNINTDDEDSFLATKRRRQQKNDAYRIFSSYPKFLPSITAGLCRLVVSPTPPTLSSLECRLLHLFKLPPALLTFGKPRYCPYRRRVQALRLPLLTRTMHTNFSEDVTEYHGGESPSSTGPREEIICCIEIPIIGGLLALGDAPTRDPSAANTANAPKYRKSSTNPSVTDRGYLRFTWIEAQCHTNQRKNHHRHQKKQQQQQQQQQYHHQHDQHHLQVSPPEIRIVTQICGRYRPTLAGHTLPIPKWRHRMYCSTQRIFHAYVMWRFHGYVMNEYGKILSKRHLYLRTHSRWKNWAPQHLLSFSK